MDLKQQALINTTGNVIYLLAQWTLTVITTRLLSYESVGILTLAMSIGNVFTVVQLYGMRSFQSSDVALEYCPGDYLAARVTTVLVGGLLCGFFCLLSGYAPATRLSVFLFLLFRTFEALSDVLYGEYQRKNRLELAGLSLFLRGAMTTLGFFAALALWHNLNAALAVIALGSAALTFALDLTLYRKLVPECVPGFSRVPALLRACFPLLLANLFPVMMTSWPRVVLERFYGPELLGIYGNISTPAVIITVVVPSSLAVFLPIYGKKVQEKDFLAVRRLWLGTLAGTLLVLACCEAGAFVLGKPVLGLFYTQTILPYIGYLYAVLVSTAIYAMTMCGACALVAMRKNLAVTVCSVSAAAVCFLSSAPLIQAYGMTGAVVTLIASYLLQLVMQAAVILAAVREKE